MSAEQVHRSALACGGWFLAFIPLGCLSITFITSPLKGDNGYVSLWLPACAVTWVVVGVASAVGFAGCCPRLSWFALMGWLIGQGTVLWYMMPAAISPSSVITMIDTAHTWLYAMVLVTLLNWPVAPGFVVGRIVKLVRNRSKSEAKTTNMPSPAAAK
jgi:hypothetical protein